MVNAPKSIEENKREQKSKLEIVMNIFGNDISRDVLYKWFCEFRFFKPTRMYVLRSSKHCPHRYTEEEFKSVVLDERNTFISLKRYNGLFKNISATIFSTTAKLETEMPIELWQSQKSEFIEKFENLFVEFGACFGFIVNYFDFSYVQNPCKVEDYSRYGVDETDFEEFEKIKDNVCIDAFGSKRVDSSFLPGHRMKYDNNMIFTPASYMWTGPDIGKFFDSSKVESFDNCEHNVEFSKGYRRICLWEDVAEYNNPIYRQRQWDFRKTLNMDQRISELRSKPLIFKNKKDGADVEIGYYTGKFSHGGTVLAVYYADTHGNSCLKSIASKCLCQELKNNEVIWQKHFKLPQQQLEVDALIKNQ